MSKLNLINEIKTALKMTGAEMDDVKISIYLDDLLTNYTIDQRDDLDVKMASEHYILMYLESLKVENYSPKTIETYRYQLMAFSRYMGDKSVLRATTADIRTYLAINDHLKPSTLVTKLDTISGFYNWLINEDELLKNPCAKIKRMKLPKKVREGLTIIELEKVRAACVKPKKKNAHILTVDDIRNRALVEVLYSTACRLDEIYKVNIKDVDWHTGAIIVCGKGNKERRVYLSEKAMFYLEQYLESRNDDCEALFTTVRKPIRRIEHCSVQLILSQIGKRAKLDRPLHPHILRHTFAQQALNAGMPMEDLQAYMGHEKADTTMRYAQISENRKMVSFKQFHVQ